MSKRIHKSQMGIVSVLESSEGFRKITGGPGFSQKASAALKKSRMHRPESESFGFGSRPSFSLGSGFDTIKSDPENYTKILRGESRKTEKKVARHTRKALSRPHRSRRPDVDPEIVAKYSRKKPRRAPRLERPTPSVALAYSFGPRSLSLRPQYALVFKGVKDAARALRRGDLLASSLVHFTTPKGERVFSEAWSLDLFLGRSHPLRTI